MSAGNRAVTSAVWRRRVTRPDRRGAPRWEDGDVLASAFAIVFSLFLAAAAVLCVLIVVWAVRRDKARWREWRERRDG